MFLLTFLQAESGSPAENPFTYRLIKYGGRGGIRIHGGFPLARFRVECLKPDSATLPRSEKKRSTFNAQRSTSNEKLVLISWSFLRISSSFRISIFGFRILLAGWTLPSPMAESRRGSSMNSNGCHLRRTSHLTRKNVTILSLPRLNRGLHIVCPKDSQRYYLLFTRIHNLFAPLFTSIRTLLKTSTLPHRHDSTKTRNSACLT